MGAQDVAFSAKGFLNLISDIAWNSVTPLEFVTGSYDRSVRIWRISESSDGDTVSVDLVWSSNIGILGAFGVLLEGVVGLDEVS